MFHVMQQLFYKKQQKEKLSQIIQESLTII